MLKFSRSLLAFQFFSFSAFLCGIASAQTTSQQLYLQCLTNFETYAETIWHTNSTGIPDAGYWGDGGSSGNGGIRGNSGIAVAYAVLCIALPNDPKFPTRLSRVRQALNYDYNTHVTGNYSTSNGKWGWSSGSLATCTSQSGSDWQSAEWSGSMGLACLLVQSNLPAATVSGVQSVVASEADHRTSIAPCTRILSSGDTKAEENGWDGNILALAAAWMTNNPSASNWLYAAKNYLVNTYTVANPDLITPNVAGDSFSNWISTVTVFPSYALENHGFYHPTYEMVAGMSSGDSLLMAKLANTNIAAQLQPFADHNVMAVWTNNLSKLVMDSGDFAYPSGVDWAVHDFEHNSFFAWMAAHFNDPLARWADDKLSQCVRYHQIQNGDGTFVGISANPAGGILFYREAVEARRTAIAWLHWANADFPTGTMTAPTNSVMNNTDVQVIHQHSAFGTFSVSYNGSRVMAMVEPSSLNSQLSTFPTNAFITSPRIPGILGLGALGNPTSASLVNFSTNTDGGFNAELKITSSLGTTEAYVKSTGESFAVIEVPRLNNGATASSGGSFICGIENDPLTGGSRVIEWINNSATMTALSGASRNVTNNWICISGRYGIAAGPSGYFNYTANTSYRRTSTSVSEAGEAEDTLSFVENNQLAPRYAVWFPTKNALQVSNLTAQISWSTNSTTATLTFPGASGAATTLSAFIGSATNISGVWSADADGLWSDGNNWSGGVIASGAGYTADFSTVNISADRTVTLDSPRSIGVLKFSDLSGAQNWILSGTNALTLDTGSSTAPLLAVTNAATISAPISGANGFTKSGPGTLILSGTNSLSGTLYLDTQSTTINDGAVRVANSASVSGVASPIYIRNNNGGSSTFQLDGSNGNINIAQDISLAGRNAGVIAIQNLAGSNTLAGNFILASGGGNYWFDCDGGTLAFSGQVPSSAPSVPSARTLTFMGAGNFFFSGAINNANGFAVNIVKTNSGTLTLNGANTYTGSTTVNGGTLAGTGTISGPVTISSDGNLSPGNGDIGALTITGALTNSGTITIGLSKIGSTPTNDTIRGVSTFELGGALQLNLLSSQITAGDSFKIFYATNFTGNFSSISPATPGVGLVWNTNNLAGSGTISISLANIQPQIGAISLIGTNLIWSGTGGAAAASFSILSATDLFQSLASWNVAGTGAFDTNGNFLITNGISRAPSKQFFTIQVP
jgi:autotransporter-associated beta strand protein